MDKHYKRVYKCDNCGIIKLFSVSEDGQDKFCETDYKFFVCNQKLAPTEEVYAPMKFPLPRNRHS